MSELSLKEALYALTEQAVPEIARSDLEQKRIVLEAFQYARAYFDPEHDKIITELPTFEPALATLGLLPLVRERYGDDKNVWERLALQFVYGFLGNLSELTFDHAVFETTWEAFWKELSEPEWTWLGLANLQNFRSESMLLDLGDGITIRGRSFEELAEISWSEWHLEQLGRDWFEGANSSHVIVIEHRELKTPDNFAGITDLAVWQKPESALLALRLFKDGDIGISRMGLLRPTSFNLGLNGDTYHFIPGSHATRSTDLYILNEPELPSVRELYNALPQYEDVREKAPVNLDLAIQSFSDMYGRQSFRSDTRLVDAITAVEALLGTEVEITFRLAFRVATILGNNDEERVAIFEQMRGYYDTRSRVVHGDRLRNKHRQHLEDQQALRDMVRRLLVGFIRLTISSGHSFGKTFFKQRLDSSLLHGRRRAELLVAMGLKESDGALHD